MAKGGTQPKSKRLPQPTNYGCQPSGYDSRRSTFAEVSGETHCLNRITEASKSESAKNTKQVFIPKYMSLQASNKSHRMSLEQLKESNGDFLNQEVIAANNCRKMNNFLSHHVGVVWLNDFYSELFLMNPDGIILSELLATVIAYDLKFKFEQMVENIKLIELQTEHFLDETYQEQ